MVQIVGGVVTVYIDDMTVVNTEIKYGQWNGNQDEMNNQDLSPAVVTDWFMIYSCWPANH